MQTSFFQVVFLASMAMTGLAAPLAENQDHTPIAEARGILREWEAKLFGSSECGGTCGAKRGCPSGCGECNNDFRCPEL